MMTLGVETTYLSAHRQLTLMLSKCNWKPSARWRLIHHLSSLRTRGIRLKKAYGCKHTSITRCQTSRLISTQNCLNKLSPKLQSQPKDSCRSSMRELKMKLFAIYMKMKISTSNNDFFCLLFLDSAALTAVEEEAIPTQVRSQTGNYARRTVCSDTTWIDSNLREYSQRERKKLFLRLLHSHDNHRWWKEMFFKMLWRGRHFRNQMRSEI